MTLLKPSFSQQYFSELLSPLLIWFLMLAATSCSDQVSEKDIEVPAGMKLIPGGEFTMGGKSNQAEADEFPRHQVRISSFLMDETEVTNRQFKAFVDATGYVTMAEKNIDWEQMKKELPPDTPKPPDSVLAAGSLVFKQPQSVYNLTDVSQWWEWKLGANWKQPEGPGSSIEDRMEHPVVHVCYDDALAYAKWAGKRLPTEAEWEWAAMGGLKDPKYPWGNESVEQAADKANFWQGSFPIMNIESDGYFGTAPVKSFPPNGYGLHDMAGNVWEWCQDKYHYQAYKEENQKSNVDPQGPETSFDPFDRYADKFVIRGGSFLCSDNYCSGYRVARRMRTNRDTGMNHTGFRCVKDID